MTTDFDRELTLLRYDTLNMFHAAREAVEKALNAVKLRDRAISQDVMDGDEPIDRQECANEARALRLLALRQPVARVLRLISGSMRIASNLERIGDEAVNIVDRNVILLERPPFESPARLWEMGSLTLEILDKATRAFSENSVEICQQVRASRPVTSALHQKAFRDLTEIMLREPGRIESAEQLSFVSYSLKRICDRCSNICESVIFIVQGLDVKHARCEVHR